MKKKRGKIDELEIDLTPMIDVIFQLIIFFMCIMKFKTFEKKVAAYLPKDVGLAQTIIELEEKLKIVVLIKQRESEGVPRIFLMGKEIKRGLGVGVRPLDLPPFQPTTDERMNYNKTYKAHWDKYIQPKLTELRSKIKARHEGAPDAPGEIDAQPTVRHAYVIGSLDCFLASRMTDVTFVGTPEPKAGE